jgi:hypothetical protein
LRQLINKSSMVQNSDTKLKPDQLNCDHAEAVSVHDTDGARRQDSKDPSERWQKGMGNVDVPQVSLIPIMIVDFLSNPNFNADSIRNKSICCCGPSSGRQHLQVLPFIRCDSLFAPASALILCLKSTLTLMPTLLGNKPVPLRAVLLVTQVLPHLSGCVSAFAPARWILFLKSTSL